MDNRFRDLQLQQMDALLKTWRAAQLSARPRSGWVRAVRSIWVCLPQPLLDA